MTRAQPDAAGGQLYAHSQLGMGHTDRYAIALPRRSHLLRGDPWQPGRASTGCLYRDLKKFLGRPIQRSRLQEGVGGHTANKKRQSPHRPHSQKQAQFGASHYRVHYGKSAAIIISMPTTASGTSAEPSRVFAKIFQEENLLHARSQLFLWVLVF